MEKRRALCLLVLIAAVAGSGILGGAAAFAAPKPGLLYFEVPGFDTPSYSIRLVWQVAKEAAVLQGVTLNGVKFEPLLVFREGKAVDLAKPMAPGSYRIVMNHAWASGRTYRAALKYLSGKSTKPKTLDFAAAAPAAGGIPAGAVEGWHRVYRLHEKAGLPRDNEIVYLTVTAPQSEIESGGLRVYDGAREIPAQVIDGRTSTPPESVAKANPVTQTIKLAVPISVSAWQKKFLFVLKGSQPAVAAPETFVLTGEGRGKTLRTGRLVVAFHPQSGQINTLEFPAENVTLHNQAGVIHWNPDVYVPGLGWDHSFDWNPPQGFEERVGGLVYANARRGPMPRVAGVDLEVRYEMRAGVPYFFSETLMTARNDLGVIALRNDEMVLSKELFDGLAYRDPDGSLVSLPLVEKPEKPFGLVHVAPPDLPWVGLTNSREGYGFFSVRLAAAASALGAGGDFHHRASTAFYAPSDGGYVYWVRPYLYTWADYATASHFTALPKGSFFYEKNAYVLLKLGPQTARELDELRLKLLNPLQAF